MLINLQKYLNFFFYFLFCSILLFIAFDFSENRSSKTEKIAKKPEMHLVVSNKFYLLVFQKKEGKKLKVNLTSKKINLEREKLKS